MTRSDAPTLLRRREPETRQLGIARLALFGSTARGDQRADSAVARAAALDPGRPMGAFEFGRLVAALEKM